MAQSHLLIAGAAFAAGLAAAAGPCVLGGVPLIVGYVCGIGRGRSRVAAVAMFVAGMVLVTVALGALVAYGGLAVVGRWWNVAVATACLVGGLFLLMDGSSAPRRHTADGPRCHTAGGPWLSSCRGAGPTPTRPTGPRGTLRAGFVLGAMFGLAASPCSTAVLIAILGLVSRSGSPTFGAALLLLYAIGHATPVAAAGLFAGALSRHLAEGKGPLWLLRIRRAAGVLLICLALVTLASP